MLTFGWLAPTQSLHAQAGANESGIHINDQLAQLRSDQSDAARRRQAVLNLLNDSGTAREQAMQSLLAELKANDNAAVHRAIVQGIRLAKERVDDAFGLIIVQKLGEWDASWIDDAAGALGRIPSTSLTQKLIQIAQAKQSTTSSQSIAIGALGYDHSQAAARTLIALLSSQNDDALKATVCRSLARLSGLDEHASDIDAWNRWWKQCENYSAQVWAQHLIDNHSHRADRHARQKSQLQDRLLLALRQRYRSSSEADRQNVLISMLEDNVAEVRSLALDLVRELLIGGEIAQPLTAALLARLDDESAAVRSVAAYVLRDLKNEKAADIAAQRLSTARETDRTVVRAYLLLIERLPRRSAVHAVLEWLEDPAVRGEAAGALIAAIDQETAILDRQTMEKAAARIRKQLKQDSDPEPRFVELLGRVGQTSDWRFIERWLDSKDAAVREAAAKVWAKYDQPLSVLAKRADDELIRAVFIPAAQLRGRSAATLTGLIKHRPAQTQLLDAWGQAIVSVAGRVNTTTRYTDGTLSPKQFIEADDLMAAKGIDMDLRLQFLSAGVEKLTRVATSFNGNLMEQKAFGKSTASPTFALELVDLLIRRARVHLADADAKASLTDLERVKLVQIDLTGPLATNIELIAVESLLRMGNIDDAFTRAAIHIQSGPGLASPLRGQMIDLFLSAADMSIASKQFNGATLILSRLRTRLGNAVNLELETRISVLEGKIKMANERTG